MALEEELVQRRGEGRRSSSAVESLVALQSRDPGALARESGKSWRGFLSSVRTLTCARYPTLLLSSSDFGERNCHYWPLVFHKYPHPLATCMLFSVSFVTRYRLQKFRVVIRISNNCKQRETPVAQVATAPCMITLISTPSRYNHSLLATLFHGFVK